jgi:hypothetical protein
MLRHSIVSQHVMEPKGSIPNSQELSTCSYPGPDQSSPLLNCIDNILAILSDLYQVISAYLGHNVIAV